MITIDNLLEEIRYGREYVDAKTTVGKLEEMIDEDYKILVVSKRADQLLKECDISKPFIKKLIRAARNYKEYESKILEAKTPSKVYVKMKADTIVEDINSAIIEMEHDKKVLRESNKEAIAKTIAVLRYGVGVMVKESGINPKPAKKSTTLIESYIKKETKLIESVV